MSQIANRIFGVLQPGETRGHSSRTLRILRHYEAEIAKGHMNINSASDRAKHDLAGRNGHPKCSQRS